MYKEVIQSFVDKENGNVDNQMLLQVYNDSCSFLLTNDSYMLKKAEKLFIRDRVITPLECLDLIETNYPELIDYEILNIKKKSFSSINLSDDFFNSLKNDYSGFVNWFKKKVVDNESAYVFELDNLLQAFLYIKLEDENEDYSDISPAFTSKRRLKIGTFKNIYRKTRIGERLLNIVFDNAIKQNVDEIYITMFEHNDEVKQLKTMLEKWGFNYWGTKNEEEIVLVKDMKNYDISKDPKYNYPLLIPGYNVFFLPIEAKYHTDLFPDMYLKNEDLKLYEDNKAHRYAIEKVYVSGNDFTKVNPGDVVIIYRMGGGYLKNYTSVITGMAIIESSDVPKDYEEYERLCSNRSIFTTEELKKFYNKYRRVLCVLNYKAFEHKITLNELRNNGLISKNEGARPFEKISIENYNKILRMVGVDDVQNTDLN